MDGKIKVLYIDDEFNNLVSFKAAFRKDYQVITAISTDEATKCLADNMDIAVIISDQRMPGKTGVEFLEEIRTKYPFPVRMLCTGYTDISAVIESINRGNVFRYIQKPWSETEIRFAIEEAYKYFLATSELAKTNKELTKANKELDKFSHSVTHELRSPILSVLGAINLAETCQTREEIFELLYEMKKAVQRLDTFITSMHDFYAVKRGELIREEIQFDSFINYLKDIFEINAISRNTRFIIETDIKDVFYSDKTLLNIILGNLLSNAFKYQRKNNEYKFVKLTIAVEDGEAIIEVQDNGIGIQESALKNIFDMFYRATNEETGSGFGLYNLKDALSKIKGDITVSSVKGEGSLFKLIIPSMPELVAEEQENNR